MADIWLTHLAWVTRQSWSSGGLDFYPAGRQTVDPRVIVLHSTETTTWPGYNRGAAAPHFTIDLRTGAARQHVPLNWGSRCLAVSSDGVTDRTVNVSGVIQIEILGAVTPGYPEKHGHYDLVKTFPKDVAAQRYLGRLLRAITDACPTIPLQKSSYGRWVTYPQSYGVRASQRLTSAEFRDARGILGHQHAPANNHGDPGALVGLDEAIAYGAGSALPDNPPTPNEDAVKALQHALNEFGNTLEIDGSYGPLTTAAAKDAAALTGYTGDVTDVTKFTTHLEDTMSKITDQLDYIKDRLAGMQRITLDPTTYWAVVDGRDKDNLEKLKAKGAVNWPLDKALSFILRRLHYTWRGTHDTRGELDAVAAKVSGLEAAVGALATQGVDADRIAAVIREAQDAALSDLRITREREDAEQAAEESDQAEETA